MKEQTRINIRSRKSAKSTSNEINRKQVKIVDEGLSTTAFRQATTIPIEPSKPIQKAEVRKSNRIASKLKQTKLSVMKIDGANCIDANTPKRKWSIASDKPITKKLKTLETTIDFNEESICDSNEKTSAVSETKTLGRKTDLISNSEDKGSSQLDGSTLVDAEGESPVTCENKSQSKEISNTQENDPIINNESVEHQQEDTKDVIASNINKDDNNTQHNEDNLVYTPHEDEYDSPSPPSFLTEPSTPPVQLETPLAPYKSYITEADKSRIEQEKSTLVKLRKALDIVITDRMARNRPTLYHQIEPVLRNSTRRTITISHLCKAMYLAPSLYQLDVKELRDFGGKVTEAFLVQFGSTWKCPLAGKDLQSRADLLADALQDFFSKNKEPNATVPEIKLPRLDLVVDKKQWIKEAKLPPGVKAILEAHKKVDEALKEKEKPKAKPTGTVKDRMAALRARLAAKKAA